MTMEIDKLKKYEEIIEYLNKKKREKHLLLGNGFSMAYDSKIFSYNALSDFIENLDDDLLKKLFATINTKNFELIMRQLDNFIEIAKVFSTDMGFIEKLKNANETLRNSLINAIKALHPEHAFIVPEEKSQSCFNFLNEFIANKGKIFSTNYDLLLYWVLMRNTPAIDGFGRDFETEFDDEHYIKSENLEYSELRWGKYKDTQNIFYLHGTLPIFDTGIDIIKEEYDTQNYLLEKINKRMEKKEYPIFVTAGNAREKLNHIMHNKYLTYCYDKLMKIEGSLIIFGFNFGEYDTHIIDAINTAAHFGRKAGNKLHSIYIGVYTDENLEHIERIRKKIKCKVNMYNARTAKIW